MLDGSLVDYSDSDESERDPDLWIQTEDLVSVVVRRTTTKSGAIVESREILKQTSKKPSQEFYIPPGGRKSFTSMSPPSISPTSPNDSVFSGEYRDAKDRKETKKSKAQSPEKSDATISKSRRRSLPAVISTYLRSPVPEHISCIPLPEETTPVLKVPDKRSSSEGSKKSKHASLPVYVPPPQRLFTPPKSEIGGSGGMEKDRPAAESDFCTPKSRKTRHSDGDKPGSGVKRKCEDQIIVKAKKQECSSGSPPLSEKVGGHSQPKKVTLKPFWMACAPPARPMNSPLTVGELPGALRSDNLSTSPQPLSLPYTWTSPLSSNDLGDVNSGPSSLPNMSRRFCVPMGSTPDSDNRLCSVSGYSCSSADISPATSMSSLELAQEDSESTRGLNRRYSQGSAIPTISRSRISSLPPRLKRQIFEGTDPNNSRQLTSNQAVTSPTTSSYWKGNFWKRYCGFQKPFIDTHCHLDFLYKREGFVGTFQKYKEVHHETFPPNFEGCVSVFCEPHSFRPKSGLWKDLSAEPDVWIAMGCHPKCAEDYTSWTEEALATCLSHPKVIAAGEFGLDYSGRFSETADRQKDVFVRQLKISLALDKPLVIHCRRAEDDTFSIMEKYVPKNVRIHRHCFTEDFNEAKRWLDSFPNLYVGLTPLVTYKSAVQTHDVARKVPLDRLLLETDAPYFVPHSIPKSEMALSHPGLAITVAEQVAYFRNIPVTQVIEATRDNTRKMYGI